MPRKKPRNNGKPLQTEPSAMQHINKNDKTDNPPLKKTQETE